MWTQGVVCYSSTTIRSQGYHIQARIHTQNTVAPGNLERPGTGEARPSLSFFLASPSPLPRPIVLASYLYDNVVSDRQLEFLDVFLYDGPVVPSVEGDLGMLHIVARNIDLAYI